MGNRSYKSEFENFNHLVSVVYRLRRECPWDREQTLESLKPYLIEEVYEAIQAINDNDFQKLKEELGDMLLHVVMLSIFAEEKKRFDIEEVIKTIIDKMIRRHPHVFGKGKAKTKEEVCMRWERIKEQEAKHRGKKYERIFDSIPQSLPALYRADKLQRRAAILGFDWDRVAGAWEKVHEELNEIRELLGRKVKGSKIGRKIKEEIGDLLFAIVNVARKLNIDAEEALQEANNKFMRRFAEIEKALKKKKKLTLLEMDALWNKAKTSAV